MPEFRKRLMPHIKEALLPNVTNEQIIEIITESKSLLAYQSNQYRQN